MLLQQRLRNPRLPAVISQIGGGNQFVQILQSHSVLYQNDLMVRFQLERVRFFAHGGIHARNAVHTLALELVSHPEKDSRQYLRVVRCPVMVKVSEPIVFGQNIELMPLQVGVGIPRHGDGIKIGV